MPEYEIIQIEQGHIVQDEQIGSKDKYWCELNVDGVHCRWLLKMPRLEPEKGEHWAEKVAAEVGTLLGVPHAEVRLANFGGIKGTISKSIVLPGSVLVHGNEVLAGRVMGYDPQRAFRTSDHTFERIREAILKTCRERSCERDLTNFGGFLVLDAFIGNTDRHHQNWALLRSVGPGGEQLHELAPSFDHASALGREMRDEHRLRLIRENRVAQYIRGGEGAVFLEKYGAAALSPIELVEELAGAFGDHLLPWLQRTTHIEEQALRIIVDSVPREWMTDASREFAFAFMLESQRLLRQISLQV